MATSQVTLTLLNKTGLHARPAAMFVQTAKKYKASIRVEKDGKEADAKSILGILALGADQGSTITIKVDGEDGEEALKILTEMVQSRFGEEE